MSMIQSNKTVAYTDDQRRVLKEAKQNPDASPKEIAEMIDDYTIKSDYCKTVMNDFILEEDLEDQTVSVGQSTPDEEDDGFVAAVNKRTLDTLAPKSKRTIEAINEDPTASVDEIAGKADVSAGTVRRASKAYSHLIPEDSAVYDGKKHPDEMSLDDLQGKTKEVIEIIRDDPNRTPQSIADEVGLRLGRSNVQMIVEKYTHLIPQEAAHHYEALEPNPDFSDRTHSNATGMPKGSVTKTEKSDEDPLFGNGKDRLDRLLDVGAIDEEEYERRVEDLERDAEAEPVGITADNDGKPVLDHTYQTFDERPVKGRPVDEIIDDYAADDGSETLTIDEATIERIEDEIEFHETQMPTNDTTQAFVAGMRRVLSLI